MYYFVMAHLRSVLATMVLLCVFVAHADNVSFTCDYGDYSLSFSSLDGVTASVISGSGSSSLDGVTASVISGGGSEVVIPSEVTSNGVTYTVTSIKSFGNTNKLTIPGSVTKLENESFRKCTSLSEIIFEPSDSPLYIGLNVTERGKYSPAEPLFVNCPLKNITLGRQLLFDLTGGGDYGDLYTFEENPEKWMYSPFYGQTISSMRVTGQGVYFPSYFFCFNLTSLYISADDVEFRKGCMKRPASTSAKVTTIYAEKPIVVGAECDFEPQFFDVADVGILLRCRLASPVSKSTTLLIAGEKFDNIVIPGDMREIPDYVFANQPLSRITIPASVKRIGVGAFKGCHFSTVSLPGVEVIADDAFADGKLATVSFGANLTKIGAGSFSNNPITVISLPASLNTIGNAAFRLCKDLTTISFVSNGSLKSIGNNAFEGCGALTTVRLPKGVETLGQGAFNGCRKLTFIDLGESLTEVSSYTFSACEALTEVTLPSTVKKVGYSAFSGCSSVAVLSLNEGLETIGQYAFNGLSGLPSLTIPSTVTKIEVEAFKDATRLTYLTFTDGEAPLSMPATYRDGWLDKISDFCDSPLRTVYLGRDIVGYPETDNDSEASMLSPFHEITTISSLTIGPKATLLNYNLFEGCSGIKTVVCGEGLRRIGKRAFARCSSLDKITLNEGLAEIGNYAFDGCSSLSGIAFPSSLSSIGNYAFNACSELAEVKFEDSSSSIKVGTGSKAGYALFGDTKLVKAYVGRDMSSSPFYSNSTLSEITFSDTYVTKLNEAYLLDCVSVKSIKLPESLLSIGNRAMRGMIALESLVIPERVETIGEYAFYGCSSLMGATMGNYVSLLGRYAFAACPLLKSCSLSSSLSVLRERLFDGDKALLTIDIPASVTDIESYVF